MYGSLERHIMLRSATKYFSTTHVFSCGSRRRFALIGEIHFGKMSRSCQTEDNLPIVKYDLLDYDGQETLLLCMLSYGATFLVLGHIGAMGAMAEYRRTTFEVW